MADNNKTHLTIHSILIYTFIVYLFSTTIISNISTHYGDCRFILGTPMRAWNENRVFAFHMNYLNLFGAQGLGKLVNINKVIEFTQLRTIFLKRNVRIIINFLIQTSQILPITFINL